MEEITFEELNKIATDNFEKYMDYGLYNQWKEYQHDLSTIVKNKWDKELNLLYMQSILLMDSYEKINNYIVENNLIPIDKEFTYYCCRSIYLKSIKMFNSIIILLQNGFTDSAFMLWRNLYENSIIICFILQEGEEIAKAYFEEDTNADTNYYMWAKKSSKISEKQRVNFKTIYDNCQNKKSFLKEQYDFASKLLHVNPKSTFFTLETEIDGDTENQPFGFNSNGLTIPIQYTTLSMFQIANKYFTVIPLEFSFLSISLNNKITQEIINTLKTKGEKND